jgi:hypothetical protein
VTQELCAGTPRQLKAVEEQRGGPPTVAGCQGGGDVLRRPGDIFETSIAAFTTGGLGQQAGEVASELARTAVSRRAVVTDVDAIGAEVGRRLVEEHSAPEAGGRNEATEGELVSQPECGEEAVAPDQGAHHPSVFRTSMVRRRSSGSSGKDVSPGHKAHNWWFASG